MGDLPWTKGDQNTVNCCNNCHFLAKTKNLKHGGPTEPESWSEDERMYSWQTEDSDGIDRLLMWREAWTPICYKGIWKTDHLSGLDLISDDVYDDEESLDLKNFGGELTEDRGAGCFF